MSRTGDDSGWKRVLARVLTVMRWVLLIILPGLIAGFGGFSGTRSGPARRNLIIAAVVSAVFLAALNVYREYRTHRLARLGREDNLNTATKLGGSGQPLVTLLQKISGASDPALRRVGVQTLLDRTVDIARAQGGSFTKSKCEPRACFYELVGEDQLVRKAWEGRRTSKVPRVDFKADRSRSDRTLIEAVKAEDYLLIEDIDKAPPKDYADYQGRAYKSLIQRLNCRVDRWVSGVSA